ncbi:MAG: hypothetical protein M3083_03740 [Actinomycetota bacterium]|nr:hypothetical protein [Actinomycetota bacterium]
MAATLWFGASGVAPARAVGQVTVDASVDGQPLGTSSQNKPVKLFPRQESLLVFAVTNGGSSPVEIRKVRLEGQVIGLTFFAYDTSVSMSVAPGATETRRLVLDLSGLDGQATGLISGAVKVLDARRHLVAQQNGVVDVRGSLHSVYGLFGLGIAFLTALSFLAALIGLARHRLQTNRWRRGLRFLTPGLGLGLVVNFTLSATRVFVPGIGRWVTITALCAVAFFALGYLTPTPDLEEEETEEAPTEIVEEIAVLAIAARPGRPALAAQPAPAQLPADTASRQAVGPARADPELPAAAPPAPSSPPQSKLEPPADPNATPRAAPQVDELPDPRVTLPAQFTASAPAPSEPDS